MPGGGNAVRRLEAFLRDRVAGAESQGFAPESLAATRLAALAEYRRRSAGRQAGLGPVPGVPNWVPLGPSAVRRGQAPTEPYVSGRVKGVAVSDDGRRVYVASANGGVWRSQDAGRTWEPMSDEFDLNPVERHVDSLACGAIALVDRGGVGTDLLYVGTGEGHVFRPGIVYSAAGGFLGVGMLRSDDGGTTWTHEETQPAQKQLLGHGVYAIAVDPGNPDHVFAATSAGIFRRVGGADPWMEETPPGLPSGTRYSGAVVTVVGGATTFVCVTADGRLATWTATGPWPAPGAWQVGPALPSPVGRVTVALSPAAPEVVYALACKPSPDDTFEGLYRTTVGAATWTRIERAPGELFGATGHGQGTYDQALAVDPHDADLLYLGGSTVHSGEWSAAIFRCRISPSPGGGFRCGATSIGSSVHPDVHALTHRPGSSSELWVGCDGGVFHAADARVGTDRVFVSRNSGLCTMTLMGLDHHPTEEAYAFCGAQDNGGLRWLGGEVWDHQLPGDGGYTVFNHKTLDTVMNGYTFTSVRRQAIDGKRYREDDVSPPADKKKTLFYPPIAGSPQDGDVVFFGAEVPWVTTNFGGRWRSLPAGPVGHQIRSLCVVDDSLVYAGWLFGNVARYRRNAAGEWVMTDFSRPAESRPITSIAVDRSVPGGRAVYVCTGGAGADHVWHLDTALPAATRWSSRSTGLLDVQHNALLVDPDNPTHVYAAADLGVWHSPDQGATWTPLENNLPDAAVLDLDLFSTPLDGGGRLRLLRATTHGRGVFEMCLEPTPATPVRHDVSLYLRANELDRRQRPARAGVKLPGDQRTRSRLDTSPDIRVELPDQNGRFRLPHDREPTLAELVELPRHHQLLLSRPGHPVTSRVHVLVRNRGVRHTPDVRVSLLLGPEGQPLPDGYVDFATTGTMTEQHGWVGVASVTAPEVWTGHHTVITFEVSSDLLPAVSEAAGKHYRLLATLHHADDPFPDLPAPTADAEELVTRCRQAALRRVTLVSGEGRTNPVGGTGLLVSMSTTVLTERRLAAIAADLRGKVTTGATVTPVERRVTAMAEAGLAALRAGPPPDLVPPPAAPTVGKYALLGSLGFELPRYTSALVPGGTWVAEVLHRGTADPHLSKVAVPATELALEFAKRAVPGATASGLAAAQGFAAGLLAGAAAGVALGPQLADLLSQDTSADWSPTSSSRGLRAVERLVRNTYLGGPTVPVTAWLPRADAVPARVWEQYVKAVEVTHGLPGVLDTGFLTDLDRGPWLTPGRLRDGYQLLLDDARTESWGFWPWFFAISPLLLMPSVAFAVARSLPHAKSFVEGGDVDERAVFEALILAEGLGSLFPFLYSMILWSKVGAHTEAFVTALLMGLVRLALPIAALATTGDESQSAGDRWAGFWLPTAGADVYAALRASLDSGRRPGNSKVFALQTAPGLTSLATLAWLGLARAITGEAPSEERSDRTFWVMTFATGVVTLAAAGIPTAIALSNGGGWRSWFLRRPGQLPLLSSVSSVGTEPLTPTAAAQVYARAALWSAPGAADDLDKLAYPAGMRDVLRFWWEGEGELSVQYGESALTFRHDGVEQVVDVPEPPTATAIVRRLEDQVPGLRTEVVTPRLADVPLPSPRPLADLGDAALVENAATLRDHFVRVPTTKAQSLPLRQSPRVEQSEQAGRVAGNQDRYVVVPADAVASDVDTGIGDAADLAALLVLASSPTLGTVAVEPSAGLPDPQVKEVMQVFRRWNLDERRADEWRSLVTGHGATAPPADPRRTVGTLGEQNVMLRPQPRDYAPQAVGREVVEALGWLPLWRAWLRVAGDVGADVAADDDAGNPEVTLPGQAARRLRNRELTEGVRFLLDLGAT